MVGQFVNINAAVGENATLPVYVTDAGSGGDHSLQSFRSVHSSRTGHKAFANLVQIIIISGYLGVAAREGRRAVATYFYTPKAETFQVVQN
jgi:hypothetical protein